MSTVAFPVAAVSIEETLPILLLSVVGAAVFTGLFLCLRRFDAPGETDGDGKGGGGGDPGPRPDQPAGPLAIVDPPLGEIRASRRRQPPDRPRERPKRIAS